MARTRAFLWLPVAALCTALPAGAHADAPSLQTAIGKPDDFRLSGSFRLRHEILDGQPRAGFRAEDEQLDIRTTLAAEYHTAAWRIGGELYDSRVRLDRPGSAVSANEVNTFELVQAYVGVKLGPLLGEGSSAELLAGRQVMGLGSRRLITTEDYRNTNNGFTGLRADLRIADGLTGTVFYVLPQVRLPDDLPSIHREKVRWDRESFDLRLWGGLVARPATIAGATAELGFVRLQERDAPGRPNRNRDLATLTGRIIRDAKPRQVDFEVEGMFQFGNVNASTAADAARLAVSASFVHAELGYSVPGAAKLHLSLEYDRASGDGPGGKFGRFDTLYGGRRSDLGPSGMYSAIGRANISTPGLRVEIAPGNRFDAFVGYRALWLVEKTDAFSTTGVRDPAGASGSFAGHQAEARMRYWLVPGFLRGEMSAAWLAKSRFLDAAPNAPRTGDTHYLATGVTATF